MIAAIEFSADGEPQVVADSPQCQSFCAETFEVASMRQQILHDVRNMNALGGILARSFDSNRGTDQGRKLAKLYGRKTCAGVVGGADRTFLVLLTK